MGLMLDDIVVGASTVNSVAQVEQAVDAGGAGYIVSPGLDAAVVARAQQLGVPVIPGAVTPTEIMRASDLGVNTVKFFPASVYGGSSAIKTLAAPFSDMHFIPTGGVTTKSLGEFLALSCVAAVGGSWMVPPKVIDARDFDRIRDLTRQAMSLVARISGTE